MESARPSAQDEVVEITRSLIRIDTSNDGSGAASANEAPAAAYVAQLLAEVGVESRIYESAPGRANLVARIPGRDRTLPALILHGHLDVVPAAAEDWSVDPFAAELIDGMIWGRGAVDMKNMDAMILTAVRELVRSGEQPPRDLIVAMFADEEAGGLFGAQWMVDNHPEEFEGAGWAISEVGGFSTTVAGTRAYLVQTAEKGMAWLGLTAQGTAGHGSQTNSDNAVLHLAQALARIGEHDWGRSYHPSTLELLEGVARLNGTTFDPEDPAPTLAALGDAAKFVTGTLATTVNPTVLRAGYKDNVIPSTASARIDVRTLPGQHYETIVKLQELAGEKVSLERGIEFESMHAPADAPLVALMGELLREADPGAEVFPYMLPAGTDNKALARLGVSGYGFAPLRLPEELDFTGMFHGVDERVPVSALHFGLDVLGALIRRF
ncbi:M20/M25/M40 family metallo-hydrolase [Galactobacter valiniphilus]|uniref:M20/M25/M40 family metallo-hydrolase n=1 Tax=Galactobacter valiniphilus TaxID=2676122 RepID=UPI001F33D8F5|nr:M20/M25/M40 family metallo-hydrolase [Galactobacter valiniphilus]